MIKEEISLEMRATHSYTQFTMSISCELPHQKETKCIYDMIYIDFGCLLENN